MNNRYGSSRPVNTACGSPSARLLLAGLLFFAAYPVGVLGAEPALLVGASTGSYAARIDNFVGEGNLRTEDRKWELGIGYIADQEDACDSSVCDDVGAYGYASVTRVLFFPLVTDVNLVMGLGLMAATGRNELLSRATNFSIQAGVEYKRMRITFRHFSNGGLNAPNRGQNLLLIGYGF